MTVLWFFALLVALLGFAWPRRKAWLRSYRAFLGRQTPRYPVVLAHGVLGFDELKIAGRSHTYFRGIAEHLRSQGVEVHVTRVDPSAEVRERAAQLSEQIRKIGAPKVNIIAHSMGGLDARYAISKLDLGKQVAALITIGTPHHGTPLADQGVAWLADRLRLRAVMARLGIQIGAFDDLTTSRLRSFNTEVIDRRGVFYGSVVGSAQLDARTHPVLRPWVTVMRAWIGDNDGLVPAGSQAWGRVLMKVDADHFAQIGWLSDFDPKTVFDALLRELALEGC